MTEDFAWKFCRAHKIAATRYRAVLMRRSLYPAARWLAPLLRLLDPEFFAADHECLETIGRLRRLRDLPIATYEFARHSDNRRFLRRTLRLRISAGRVQDIVHSVMNDVVER